MVRYRYNIYFIRIIKKGKFFYGQEPPSGEFTTTECGVNYQLLAVICWSSRMGNSYHNQLRTLASGTVDTIDWSHLPPSWEVPPELHVLHGVNVAYKSQDLLHQPGVENKRPLVCRTNSLPLLPLRVCYCVRIQLYIVLPLCVYSYIKGWWYVCTQLYIGLLMCGYELTLQN